MSFLPIVERELRVAARKRSTYRVRMAYAVLTSLAMAGLIVIGGESSSRQGRSIFPFLSTLAFFFSLLAGVRLAADAISEEKREGTIGLLFLTDLRGYDVVLGKLASVLARTAQGLLAFLPVLALGLVLGGITHGEFWRSAALLCNALFFASCASLWVSSVSRESQAAVAGSAIVVLGLFLCPLVADWLIPKLWPGSVAWWEFLSPGSAARFAPDLNYRASPGRFWSALILNHVTGWGFLAAASLALPRVWQDCREKGVRPVRDLATREEAPARREKRRLLRTQLLDKNPILWLVARRDRQRTLIWSGIIAATALAVGLLLSSPAAGLPGVGAATAIVLLVRIGLRLTVAWCACATLAEAQRSGAAELLLATPLRVDQIIQGHWQALQRLFLGPVILALALNLLPGIETLLQQGPGAAALLFPLPAFALFSMLTFVLDLLAAGWVGMWLGLIRPRPVQAFARTVLLTMILPAITFCLPNVLFDLFWISWAKRNLEQGFRKAAAERSTPRQSGGLVRAAPDAKPPVLNGV